MSEIRERLAKAIFEGGKPDRRPAESWDELPIDQRGAFYSVADLALEEAMRPTEDMLRTALLWLRNAYDVGKPENKEQVIAVADKIIDEDTPTLKAMQAFREKYRHLWEKGE